MQDTYGLVVNLFRINPSKDMVRVSYIESSDVTSINQYVSILRDAGCIAAPQYGEYLGLASGVYFVCEDLEVLKKLDINYTERSIDSSSYVMKYLVLNALARKVRELGDRGLLYLHEDKVFAYSQVTFCDKEVIMRSEPYKLFELRPCLILRVEHYHVEGRNMLFLLADLKFKRINKLTLTRLIKILEEKGYEWTEIRKILREHYYTCKTEEGRQACLVDDIVRGQDRIVAKVMTREGMKELPADNVWLNPHPKHTRDFICDKLGELLDEVWKEQRKYGNVRPKAKIRMIREYLEKLLVKTGVFPLRISDVEYNLDLRPQKLLLTPGDEE